MKHLIEIHEAFKNVKFEETSHSYFIDKEKVAISVTGYIKQFDKPFESDKISFFVARKRGVDQQVVLDEWKKKGDDSAAAGTIFHKAAENLYNNKLDVESFNFMKPNMKKALISFYESSKSRFVLIRSEMVIGDKEWGIAGCIDFLGYDIKDDSFFLLDWKTNKEIDETSKTKLLNEFSEFDGCKLNLYSLQLSTYKAIIEKNCKSINIKKMILVNINGESDKPKVLKCKDFSKQITEHFNSKLEK